MAQGSRPRLIRTIGKMVATQALAADRAMLQQMAKAMRPDTPAVITPAVITRQSTDHASIRLASRTHP